MLLENKSGYSIFFLLLLWKVPFLPCKTCFGTLTLTVPIDHEINLSLENAKEDPPF